VLCGLGFKNKACMQMLEAVVDYLPSPSRRARHQARDEDGNEVAPAETTRSRWRSAFKIMDDPFVGTIPSGHLVRHAAVGTGVINSTGTARSAIGGCAEHANNTKTSGSLPATSSREGLKEARTADTLLRPEPRRGFWQDGISGAGSSKGRDRAEVEGRPGKDGVALAKNCTRRIPRYGSRQMMMYARPSSRHGRTHLDIKVDILRSGPTRSMPTSAATAGGVPRARTKRGSRLHTQEAERGTGRSRGKFIVEPNEPGKGFEFE